MKWAMSVYLKYVRISFQSAAAYRANFFFTICISMIGSLLVPLVTVLIYAGGASLPGWTFPEVLLIQSVYMLCTGICAPQFSNMVWITMQHIREGTYDMIMLKPCSALFITVASAFDIENVGTLAGGIAMFAYSVAHLSDSPAAGNWLLFGALIAMGVLMTMGCMLLMAASTFKWVGNSRIYEIFDSVTLLGRYPGTIFARPLMRIGTYLIPVAMMGYIPAAALMGRSDAGLIWACVPCALFALLGLFVFQHMTYRYQSAGG